MNRPFQFSVGSHSSALIFESLVGFNTSITRQCAGTACVTPWPTPRGGVGRPRRGAAGGGSGLAATDSVVIATCGVDIDCSESQVVAGAVMAAAEARMKPRLSMGAPLLTVELLTVETVYASVEIEFRDEQIALRADGHAVRREHEARAPLV